jgi:hypothetical protein
MQQLPSNALEPWGSNFQVRTNGAQSREIDCQNCGHRRREFSGKDRDSGLALDVCRMCKYMLAPETVVRIWTPDGSEQTTADLPPCVQGEERYEVAPSTVVQEGHMLYTLDYQCPDCNWTAAKLPVNKQNVVWIPPHKVRSED